MYRTKNTEYSQTMTDQQRTLKSTLELLRDPESKEHLIIHKENRERRRTIERWNKTTGQPGSNGSDECRSVQTDLFECGKYFFNSNDCLLFMTTKQLGLSKPAFSKTIKINCKFST